MSLHVMIDLETFGVRPDAAICQIGAVAFEAKSGGKILNKADMVFNEYVMLQDGAGSIDHGTVTWWLGQKPEAVKRLHVGLSSKAIPLQEALQKLRDWPAKFDASWETIEGVWANGQSFDPPVLASAYAKFGQTPPWRYNAGLDTRTLFWFLRNRPTPDATGLVSHDALDDSIYQAMQVQMALGSAA